MIVRKVRGQNKVGKIILTRTQVETVRKMGVSIEKYVKTQLVMIAKRRRWKWYFNKEST
jgi:hypothetical protein